MSDPTRIATSKKANRDKETLEKRHILALEEIADSLEAIRQDLTSIAHVLPTLKQASQKP
jgi:hypothetical protein